MLTGFSVKSPQFTHEWEHLKSGSHVHHHHEVGHFCHPRGGVAGEREMSRLMALQFSGKGSWGRGRGGGGDLKAGRHMHHDHEIGHLYQPGGVADGQQDVWIDGVAVRRESRDANAEVGRHYEAVCHVDALHHLAVRRGGPRQGGLRHVTRCDT